MGLKVSRIGSYIGHRDSVYCLTRGMGDEQFLSGSGDGMMVQWDLADPDEGALMAKVPTSIYSIEKHPDNPLVTMGQNFEGVQVVDISQKKQIGSLKLTSHPIFSIAHVGTDETWIGTGGGELIVIDRMATKVLFYQTLSNERIRAIVWQEGSDHVAVGGSDNLIRKIDRVDKKECGRIGAHTNSVLAMTYSPDGKYLISVGRDAHIRIWDAAQDYFEKKPIVAHMYAINHIAFSPSGRYFATCSMDKSVKIWCGHSFKLLKVLDKVRHAGHGTSVNRLLWLKTDEILVSCSDDRTIAVWHLENVK